MGPASGALLFSKFAASSIMSKAATPLWPISYMSCGVTVAPIRREPTHRAEQVSQLLFGERVEVLQLNAETDWVQIRCAWDGYEGWCKAGQLQAISTKDFRRDARTISASQNGAIHPDSGVMRLPMGAELTGLKKGSVPIGAHAGKFKGKKLDLRKAEKSPDILLDAALSFMHSPYQWGGRTSAGIDCSGLVQMAFKLCGIPVLRDASEQATMGAEVHFLAESKGGDVAFFDNAEGRIVHVGILADKHTIIHATDTSGRVVEDRIDNAGIISISLKRRTHNLRAIRRIGW